MNRGVPRRFQQVSATVAVRFPGSRASRSAHILVAQWKQETFDGVRRRITEEPSTANTNSAYLFLAPGWGGGLVRFDDGASLSDDMILCRPYRRLGDYTGCLVMKCSAQLMCRLRGRSR